MISAFLFLELFFDGAGETLEFDIFSGVLFFPVFFCARGFLAVFVVGLGFSDVFCEWAEVREDVAVLPGSV